MAKRGRKPQRETETTSGVVGLQSRNITVNGHRTSMRLEPSMWSALEDIAERERMTVNDLCTRVKMRVDEQARQRGIDPEQSEVTLTSAVRVFIAAYYRRAATPEGHSRSGHGLGDPFVGTPFEMADDQGEGPGDAGGPSSGDGPGFSGSGRGAGLSGMAAGIGV